MLGKEMSLWVPNESPDLSVYQLYGLQRRLIWHIIRQVVVRSEFFPLPMGTQRGKDSSMGDARGLVSL